MNAFLIQKGTGSTDLWEDFSSAINITCDTNIGIKPIDLTSKIKLFETVDKRFVFSNYNNNPSNFFIKKPHDVANIAAMYFNLNEIIDAYSKIENWADYVLFASYLDENSTQESVAKSCSFFIRNKDGQIKDVRSGQVYENDITLIPWFAVYKLKDVSVYYVILNNKTVVIGDINEEVEMEDNKLFVTDYHLGNFRNLIFTPSVSRNARLVNENFIFVKGNKFTIKPFDSWFVRTHLPKVFDSKKLKCSTNFKYHKDDDGIHFELTDDDGYIIIRWPEKVSMFHGIFLKSKNALYREYIVKKIREQNDNNE